MVCQILDNLSVIYLDNLFVTSLGKVIFTCCNSEVNWTVTQDPVDECHKYIYFVNVTPVKHL